MHAKRSIDASAIYKGRENSKILQGLWSKAHKKNHKEVAVCSIGMEVVMLEEKKDCNTLGVYLSENFYLLSLLNVFHEETGL